MHPLKKFVAKQVLKSCKFKVGFCAKTETYYPAYKFLFLDWVEYKPKQYNLRFDTYQEVDEYLNEHFRTKQ
jgi:hypothetical protein